MKVIGLTGGIGSGKSTVSNYLKSLNYNIIDCDIIARQVVEKGSQGLKEIVDYFGREVLNNDETLNRKLLGSIVFNDKSKLEVLNNITHPKIIDEINNQIKFYDLVKHNKVVFLDAPLLIEMELYKMVNAVWLVSVSKEVQIERVMKRDNLSLENTIKRINSQMTLQEKEKYANTIIDNSYDIETLNKNINKALNIL